MAGKITTADVKAALGVNGSGLGIGQMSQADRASVMNGTYVGNGLQGAAATAYKPAVTNTQVNPRPSTNPVPVGGSVPATTLPGTQTQQPAFDMSALENMFKQYMQPQQQTPVRPADYGFNPFQFGFNPYQGMGWGSNYQGMTTGIPSRYANANLPAGATPYGFEGQYKLNGNIYDARGSVVGTYNPASANTQNSPFGSIMQNFPNVFGMGGQYGMTGGINYGTPSYGMAYGGQSQMQSPNFGNPYMNGQMPQYGRVRTGLLG